MLAYINAVLMAEHIKHIGNTVYSSNNYPITSSLLPLVSKSEINSFETFFLKNKFLSDIARKGNNILYYDPVIILIIWLLKNKKYQLREKWPLTFDELQKIANDFGETYQ